MPKKQKWDDDGELEVNFSKISKSVITFLVVAILIATAVSSVIYTVPEGHAGVLFSKLSEYDYAEKTQGWGLKMPFVESVTDVSFRTRDLQLIGESALTPKDKNGVNFNQEMLVRYRLDKGQIVEFFELKGDNTDSIVYSALRGSARNILGKYAQEDVPDKRGQIGVEIKEALQERLNEEKSGKLMDNYIIIEAVDVRNTLFDARIEDAIVSKQERQQQEQKMTYELNIAEKNREIAIVQASAKKNATILEAEGKAKAIILEANAKAEGIQAINDAYQKMPKEYVEVKYAEALKAVANDGNSVVMDFGRFSGGSNIGLLDYNKLMPVVKNHVSEE